VDEEDTEVLVVTMVFLFNAIDPVNGAKNIHDFRNILLGGAVPNLSIAALVVTERTLDDKCVRRGSSVVRHDDVVVVFRW